jgi:hypothetical protein
MTEWRKSFLHVRTGKCSDTLREMYAECSEEERQLSAEFYERYLAGRGTGDLTPFAGILVGPGPLANTLTQAFLPVSMGSAQRKRVKVSGAGFHPAADFQSAPLISSPFPRLATTFQSVLGSGATKPTPARMPVPRCLQECLADALAESLPEIGEVDVAVSGGIDSWLLAAMLRALGYRVRGWYLESGIPGYCERDQVAHFSAILGVPCRYIRVTAKDFLAYLPEFLSVTETPIYNLHPVSKWLLAKALHREGISTLVTGDGADQVMRHEWDCDLLPLTLACFQGAGLRLITPFLAPPVIGFCRVPDPDKRPIRELARQLGVPSVPKHPTLFPAVDLPRHPRALLPGIDLGGQQTDDEKRSSALLLSYTTGLLLQALEEHEQCAGSLA